MKPKLHPAPAGERSLWGVALLLLGFVLCLLMFVLRTFLLSAPEPPAAPPELPRRSFAGAEPARQRTTPFVYPVPRPAPVERAPAPEPVVVEMPLPAKPVSVAVARPEIGSVSFGGFGSLGLGLPNYRTAVIGKVTLHGTPPAEQPLPLSSNAFCAEAKSHPLTTRSFVVGQGSGLADVLVFLSQGLPRRLPASARQHHELAFTNCQMTPYVLGVRRGETLTVKNDDASNPAAHTVRLMPAQTNALVARVRPRATVNLALSFPPELLIPCQCELHPWESAYVSVFDHPFFAVTSAEGSFILTNIPPGKYVLEACHPKSHGTKGLTQSLTLRPGEVVTANFVIEAPPLQSASTR